ncbi:alpha-L-rhamnosidase [Macrophomina phaseolina]|uniref:Alpha-L-rhamnosidase n=1 Tax=Macrophomina phaseolina TaxID=35725 RepID=A0ABQ8G3A0_9PEZI|nr:alpha-L-rhamnosidase [Macrophomina phaseolina]
MHLSSRIGVLLPLVAAALHCADAADEPWKRFILSPHSRTVQPISVHSVSGDAIVTSNSDGIVLTLNPSAQVSLDFGVEVGGLLSFNTKTEASSTPLLALAFAESPLNVREISDDATGSAASQDWDRELNVSLPKGVWHYSMPAERFRGGFRFVTVTARAPIVLTNITCGIGFSPSQADLTDYSGHFFAPQDELLTRIWYAGAYTTQTNIGPANSGRFLPQVRPGWSYNSSAGVAGPLLMDGAKRDRAVWPGDHGISGQTALLALGEAGLQAFHNSLETMFYYQNSTTGRFPYAGPSTRSFNGRNASDTYHAWNLIAIYNYAIFTGDQAWVEGHWKNISRGVDYILAGLNNTVGLHNQSTRYDWGRQGAGEYNSALNALDYHALNRLSSLAVSLQKTDLASSWMAAAARLKAAYNKFLWDFDISLYRDNTTTSLHPQDGNALALLFNLTENTGQAAALSLALTRNWNSIGPVTPELPDVISPFISGVEVLGHFKAGNASRALQLTRRLWGYLLDSPIMTGSTFAEGLAANGSLYYRGASGYNFDAAYTSMSHSWSSAPTIALTTRVAGLEITGWLEWTFAPQPGGLSEATSGFRTPFGHFRVEWVVRNGTFTATLETPPGTTGSVNLPWRCGSVTIDGLRWTGLSVKGGSTHFLHASGCQE